ncbi:hypothetical protein Y032_0011g1446 [Ancylostoma ceylanicum]|uniref:Uncharacterized protein n=1 Tax=Ancylostoma ceylanicum TaxID=53326 RepID=A0A016VF21_9BILA|nr:hypothetical protein Y032_0011g1446 [Ancylostoma ceylanicum]
MRRLTLESPNTTTSSSFASCIVAKPPQISSSCSSYVIEEGVLPHSIVFKFYTNYTGKAFTIELSTSAMFHLPYFCCPPKRPDE